MSIFQFLFPNLLFFNLIVILIFFIFRYYFIILSIINTIIRVINQQSFYHIVRFKGILFLNSFIYFNSHFMILFLSYFLIVILIPRVYFLNLYYFHKPVVVIFILKEVHYLFILIIFDNYFD